MKFRRVPAGYSPKEVQKYVEKLMSENQLHCMQKQRIDELAEENHCLRAQLKKYEEDSQAIAQTLVQARKEALAIKAEAEKYSQETLRRAKQFYAAWSGTAKTLVAALSDEEVRSLNRLKNKLEGEIASFEGNGQGRTSQPNPVSKVAASAAVIDLEELVRPTESLEELCRSLGLNAGSK